MNQKILFNFASRSRPEKFKKVVRNIQNLCMSDNYIIWAKIDEDDDSGYTLSSNNHLFVAMGRSLSKIHAINRDIPKTGWDIIVDVSDDFVFTKRGFDNVIRKYCGPDDCVHFPEPFANKQSRLNRNDDIIIMACMGKQYFDRFGYIFNPLYKSLFCDNELTAVAKMLGRYKLVTQQIFYHAHPQAGFGKADDQTRFTESFWAEDEKVYNERKSKGFLV